MGSKQHLQDKVRTKWQPEEGVIAGPLDTEDMARHAVLQKVHAQTHVKEHAVIPDKHMKYDLSTFKCFHDKKYAYQDLTCKIMILFVSLRVHATWTERHSDFSLMFPATMSGFQLKPTMFLDFQYVKHYVHTQTPIPFN